VVAWGLVKRRTSRRAEPELSASLYPIPAGRLLDVEVLDHIVIGLGRFVSLKDRGLGF
jgi:DNA repair protein RadC